LDEPAGAAEIANEVMKNESPGARQLVGAVEADVTLVLGTPERVN